MDLSNLKPVGMDIKVLGTGCTKCKTLEKATRKAVEELHISATIEKVEDIQEIMAFGVMSTPGLVINGQVVFSGKLPKDKELKQILSERQ